MFHCIREVFNDSAPSLTKIAQHLQIDLPERAEFLRSVVTFAKKFLEENERTFQILEGRHSNSNGRRMSDRDLANTLASLAQEEIAMFFHDILSNSLFDRGEVSNLFKVGLMLRFHITLEISGTMVVKAESE